MPPRCTACGRPTATAHKPRLGSVMLVRCSACKADEEYGQAHSRLRWMLDRESNNRRTR